MKLWTTTCEKCIFSIKDENEEQIGCFANRIELYVKQKVASKEEGNKFYTIENRICNLCRAKDSPWNDGSDLEKLLIKAKKEVIVNTACIITCEQNSSIEDILKTAKSLEKQTLQTTVFFNFTSNIPKTSDLIPKLRKLFPANSRLAWKVNLCYERDNGKPLTPERASDLVVNQFNPQDFTYYLMLTPGVELPESFLDKINTSINKDLNQFIYLMPIEYEDNKKIGPLVHTATHYVLGGNKYAEHDVEVGDGIIKTITCDTIFDKIKQVSTENKQSFLIKNIQDICLE